jgi:hypothetical protein
MSDAVLVALIAASPPTLLAVISLFKIEKVHKATNSMKDALVKSTGESSFAAGREAGRDESKIEVKNIGQ